jgi:hypothetical protein
VILTKQPRFQAILSASLLATFLVFASASPSAADTMRPLTNIPFEEVTSPAGPASNVPNLTVGNGTAYLSWIESPAGGAPALKFSRWQDSVWTSPQTVVSDPELFVNWADFPSFLVLGDGTLVTAWLKKSGSDSYAYDVWVSTSKDNGLTWAAPLRPHKDNTKTEHGFVSLMTDPVEGFWTVWLDGRNYSGKQHEGTDHGKGKKTESPETQLRASLWRGGSFGEEVLLDGRVCDCCQTAAIRTLEGLAVAYRDRSPEQIRDISVIRYERRVWDKPFTPKHDGWKIEGCPVSGPAMSARENLLALAWFTDANEKPQVFVSLSDSSAFALSRLVQVDDGNPLGRVDVKWLPDESVLVTWIEQVGEGAEIRARRVMLTGEKDEALLMAHSSVDRSSGFPKLAVQSTNVWMAWTDVTSDPSRVRIGRLDLSKWE